MIKTSEFERHAKDCRDLAKSLGGEQRAQMLKMAESWDKLAAERRAQEQPKMVADPEDAKGG